MTPTTTAKKTTLARAAFTAFVLTGALSTQAGAVSLGVKLACASDYYSYCSQHAVGSPAVRQCMRSHGPQLSNRCVSALIAAGEVSKSEVDRKRAMAAKKAASQTASAN
ncbi:MAG TPA: hypothetical protein VEA77_01580 [Hyphomicrobium sp.]|nr:hypothetical protein [Hyphomicrobium sp.]